MTGRPHQLTRSTPQSCRGRERNSAEGIEDRNRHEDAIRRILHEYLALPGLSLTPSQMKRLLVLDEDACQDVLAALVDTGYVIHRPADGQCVRPPEMDLGAWRRAVHRVLRGTRAGPMGVRRRVVVPT